MATKITKTPKTKKTPAKKTPTPASRPSKGFPKTRVKAVYVEKGADAARALGEKLGITKGRLNRWLTKEWPGKVATAKPTTKKKNGKASGKPVEAVKSNGRQTVKDARS